MEIKDLAPWLAIAVTLALSILVPLFTQIVNNKHQQKLHEDNLALAKYNDKKQAYEEFLLNVGECVTFDHDIILSKAGASLHKLYLFVPEEWHEDLEDLSKLLRKYSWDEAGKKLRKLSAKMADDLRQTKI